MFQQQRHALMMAATLLTVTVCSLALTACGSGDTGSAETGVETPAAGAAGSGDTSTATSPEAQELIVSAAPGLKKAFTDIGRVFDERNNTATIFNYATVGILQRQIEGGAPADVFASSDPKNMQALLDAGLVDAPSVQAFASDEIVLIVPADSDLTMADFRGLADPDVDQVATGNPDSTPLGVATLKILSLLDLSDSVQPKIVYTESVIQTVEYVARAEVEAGIVWASEARAGGEKVRVVATADPDWYGEVQFVIGTVEASQKKDLGQAFVDFVLGVDGQAILREHGFLEAPPD